MQYEIDLVEKNVRNDERIIAYMQKKGCYLDYDRKVSVNRTLKLEKGENESRLSQRLKLSCAESLSFGCVMIVVVSVVVTMNLMLLHRQNHHRHHCSHHHRQNRHLMNHRHAHPLIKMHEKSIVQWR